MGTPEQVEAAVKTLASWLHEAGLRSGTSVPELALELLATLARSAVSSGCDCAAKNIACLHWAAAAPSGRTFGTGVPDFHWPEGLCGRLSCERCGPYRYVASAPSGQVAEDELLIRRALAHTASCAIRREDDDECDCVGGDAADALHRLAAGAQRTQEAEAERDEARAELETAQGELRSRLAHERQHLQQIQVLRAEVERLKVLRLCGGTMTAEEVAEVWEEVEKTPPILPSRTGTIDLLEHIAAQDARGAVLEQQVTDLEKSLASAEKERDILKTAFNRIADEIDADRDGRAPSVLAERTVAYLRKVKQDADEQRARAEKAEAEARRQRGIIAHIHEREGGPDLLKEAQAFNGRHLRQDIGSVAHRGSRDLAERHRVDSAWGGHSVSDACEQCGITLEALTADGRQLYACDAPGCGADCCSTCSEDSQEPGEEVLCLACARERETTP